MQNLIKALEISIDHNLSDFSIFLWQNNIPHRINEAAGKQVLWVTSMEDQRKVLEAYELIKTGKLVLKRVPKAAGVAVNQSQLGGLHWLARFPVTLCAIVLSILGALLVNFDATGEFVRWFTFQPFEIHGNRATFYSAQNAYQQGEYWRLITPVFLHFGLLHVVFNSLWVWELGKRLELARGSFNLLGVMLLIGIGSNIGQDFWQTVQQTPAIFGGMSGVVYGLLGYIWLVNRFKPDPLLTLPPGIMVFMLGWLVFCMTGIIEIFGPDNTSVANAAHLCGLIMGFILGIGNLIINKVNRSEG